MQALAAIIVVLLIAAASVFLADRPGTISIDWQGWRIDTSVAGGLLILILAVLVLWLLFGTVRRLIAAPRRYKRQRREARLLQGYRALTLGLVAVGGGDGKEAERQRLRGERAFKRTGLGAPPLTRLLAAQAALLRGDDAVAKGEFNAMLGDDDLAFLGLRGLIVQALKDKDERTALDLIARAKRLKPDSPWVLQTELALEARTQEWRLASETLRAAVKQGAISTRSGRDYEIALLVARSRQAGREDRQRDALTFATQAVGLDNSFVPAVVSYAHSLATHKKTGKAIRAIETAWTKQPHPELAQAYDKLLTEETPTLRFRRFERLAALRPDNKIAHLSVAAVALPARLWGEMRRHLESAGASGPGPWSQRLCWLMSELEQGDRADAAAAMLWQGRAHSAEPDASWICNHCAEQLASWEPVCPHCQEFGTFAWTIPRALSGRMQASDTLISAIEGPLTNETAPSTPFGSFALGDAKRRA